MDLKAGSVCHITTWPCCPNWHSVNETRVMAKPFCVSSMCHMSTTDVLHTKKWDCSERGVSWWTLRQDEKIQTGIRKCMNTKAWRDEVRRRGSREIRWSWTRGSSQKSTKARETRTVRSEQDRDSILEMIPHSFHALYPRRTSPPATPSSFLFDDPIILSSPCTQPPPIHTGTFANIQAPKHACI